MNDHEAQRIAAAAHELRPDWPASSVLTIIRKGLMDKPRRDVSVALAWIACESNTSTPARVLETGPWWRAAGVEGATSKREQLGIGERCSVCSLSEPACRIRWAADHDFESAALAAQKAEASDPAAVTGAIAAIRAGIKPTEPERHGKGLEDLADRNPSLRAKVDALRAVLPATPPLREPEPEPTPEGETA